MPIEAPEFTIDCALGRADVQRCVADKAGALRRGLTVAAAGHG